MTRILIRAASLDFERHPHFITLDFERTALTSCLKSFLIVGGIPTAVAAYIEMKNYLSAQEQHQDILVSLKSDFGKYNKRISSTRISAIFNRILEQTAEKFSYSDPSTRISYRGGKECTTLLETTRLSYRIDACHANGVPLGADVKASDCEFLFLGTGLYLTASGLDLSQWITDEPTKFVNRGRLAEMFAELELAKVGSPLEERRLFYWHREVRNSSTEVDYIVQFKTRFFRLR